MCADKTELPVSSAIEREEEGGVKLLDERSQLKCWGQHSSNSFRNGVVVGASVAVLIVALIVGLWMFDRQQQDIGMGQHSSGSSSNSYNNELTSPKYGAVSTSHYLATEAAMQVLKSGGNAADAAATAQFVLNVVQPMSTGIGGGCLAMIYNRTSGSIFALDGREEAPDAYSPNTFCAGPDCLLGPCNCSLGPVPISVRNLGGHSVGVPGVVSAMDRLLSDFGTMNLAQAVQPAISIARNGFPMYHDMDDRLRMNIDRLSQFNASASLYLNATRDGPRVQIGETWTNPDLADTLTQLGDNGASWFYNGPLAEEIVSAARSAVCKATGKYGLMTLNDIAGYKAVYRSPIVSTYRGDTLYGMDMPSSGGTTVAATLNLLEAFDLPHMPGYMSAESTHRMVDCQNAAWADRDKYAADADFVSVPVAGLIDKTYAAQRRNTLMSAFAAVPIPVPPGTPPGTSASARRHAIEWDNGKHGTTHLNVLDANGLVVSLTTTIESNFGSAVVVPGRGFLLNNELTDFAEQEYDPSGARYANCPEGGKKPRRTALGADSTTLGGKRPRSSMSPTIVLDSNGTFALSVGSAGGSTIIGTVIGLISAVVDFGMNAADAIGSPRLWARNDQAEVEWGLTPGGLALLQSRGVAIKPGTGLFPHPEASRNVAQMIVLSPNGTLSAAGEIKMRFTVAEGVVA